MRRSTSRWIVGLGLAGIAHMAIFWAVAFLSRTETSIVNQPRSGPQLSFIGPDRSELSPIMRQQIVLFDPKPLMLPTEWNAANFSRLEDYVNHKLELFDDYKAVFEGKQGDFVDAFGNPWEAAGSAKENGLAFPYVLTERFGRVKSAPKSAMPMGLGLSITEIASGSLVFTDDIYNNAAQEFVQSPEFWAPTALLVQIVDSFPVGAPLAERSSGFTEIDHRLSDFLMRQLIPKGLLRDGAYLVEISR